MPYFLPGSKNLEETEPNTQLIIHSNQQSTQELNSLQLSPKQQPN